MLAFIGIVLAAIGLSWLLVRHEVHYAIDEPVEHWVIGDNGRVYSLEEWRARDQQTSTQVD